MAWKNGLGVTTEIAIEPPDATLARFDWRLSMARLDAGGPFSIFPNTDRLLMVLEGRVDLAIEGRPLVTLTPEDEPVGFPGELAVMATLPTQATAPARPVIDLNVMVRRGRYEPHVQRLEIERQCTFRPTAETTAFICRTPGLRVSHEQGAHDLEQDDALLVSGRVSRPMMWSHASTALLCVVELNETTTHGAQRQLGRNQ